jgi:hypothetical protein
MIRLLQRMDDEVPRPAAEEEVPTAHALRPVALLADADESSEQALSDWARGLDWVEWLFSSIRQRMTHLHFQPPASSELLRFQIAWETFAQDSLPTKLAPQLMKAWQAAEAMQLESLIYTDTAFGMSLSDSEKTQSLDAGRLLLKATRGARYQGILKQYRTAIEEGRAPGHFLSVWATVGHFFQLSLTNLMAEYLRLEWHTATRDLPGSPTLAQLPRLTSRLLQDHSPALRVVV